MTSIVQDIQVVRSLRKDLREVKLPSNILNSIGVIHNCIKSGTDLNGWKKVEWRNNGGAGGSSAPRGSGSGQRSGPNTGQGFNRSGNSFFSGRQNNDRQNNDRQSNDRYEQQSSSSHYAFGNRNKGGFSGRQSSEPPVSIPLTNSNTPITSETTPTQAPAPTPVVSSDGFRTAPSKVC